MQGGLYILAELSKDALGVILRSSRQEQNLIPPLGRTDVLEGLKVGGTHLLSQVREDSLPILCHEDDLPGSLLQAVLQAVLGPTHDLADLVHVEVYNPLLKHAAQKHQKLPNRPVDA